MKNLTTNIIVTSKALNDKPKIYIAIPYPLINFKLFVVRVFYNLLKTICSFHESVSTLHEP